MVNSGVNVASAIVVVPWVARALGVGGFGAAGFAQTYAELFSLFISLGIPMYGIRAIGRAGGDGAERRAVVSELVRITLLGAAIFTALYAVSIAAVPVLRAQWRFLAAAGGVLIVTPLGIDWYFAGRENMRLVMWRNLAVKLIGLAATLFFVRDGGDIAAYLLIGVVMSGGAAVWTFRRMWRDEGGLRWRGLRTARHMRPVLYLFLSTVAAVAFTRLDTVMLGLVAGNVEVGLYQSAIKANKALLPIITASAAAVIPRIAQLAAGGDAAELRRVTDRSFALTSLVAPPVATGIFAIAPVFVPLYFGPGFEGAVATMRILSTVVVLIAVSNFYGTQVLVATGHDREYMWAIVAGMAANVALNLGFIPRWGAVGASWASVVAECAIVAVTVACVHRRMPDIRPSYATLVRSVVSSLPMLAWGAVFAGRMETANLSPALATAATVACSTASFAVMELALLRDPTAREIASRLRRTVWKRQGLGGS